MKKSVKTFVALGLSLCIILILIACGKKDSSNGLLTVVADSIPVGKDLEVNPWSEDSANSNGSGIYFNSKLWVFYPTYFKIKYRTYSQEAASWDAMQETSGSSGRPISPIIYKGTLFIFWVQDNKIKYKHFTGTVTGGAGCGVGIQQT